MTTTTQPQVDLPAIAGGTKAKKTPYGTWQRYDEAELTQLKAALAQNTLFYVGGTKVKEMEKVAAATIGRSFAIATTSGTASIHTALMTLGISPGDEVITAPITDMGGAIGTLVQGAIPVFADLDPRNYCMTPAAAARVITKKTRAIVPVHLWGNACDMDGFLELSRKTGIPLIEDCAQAWGATYKGKYVGSMAPFGCFSLNEFKHISCGDGGLVVMDDPDLAKKARLATDKCYSRDVSSAQRDPNFLAMNYRMTELQGAVALAQFGKLAEIVAKRRAWANALRDALADIPGLDMPAPTEGSDPSWWFFMFRVNSRLGTDAAKFADALAAEGLRARARYINSPVYQYPVFANHSAFDHGQPHPYAAATYRKGLCPVTEEILETCIVISVNEAFTQTDLEETIHGVRRAARYFSSTR